MKCACVTIDDYGGPEFHTVKMHTARKTHKCYECNRRILPGEVYERIDGMWEGHFLTMKTCPTCLEVRLVFFCDGWQYGGVWELLSEHIFEMGGVSEDCVAGLSPKARAEVCDLIESKW